MRHIQVSIQVMLLLLLLMAVSLLLSCSICMLLLLLLVIVCAKRLEIAYSLMGGCMVVGIIFLLEEGRCKFMIVIPECGLSSLVVAPLLS